MKIKFYLSILGINFLFCNLAYADLDINNTADDAVAAAQKNNDGPDFSGYIDGSYNYLQNSNQFISGVNDRIYDLQENGFTLQQLAVTVADQPDTGFGALVNMFVGQDAFTTAAYGFNPEMGLGNVGFDILQAYMQYAFGKLTLIGGKFVALPGAEAIDPTQDTNFSRAILFGYGDPGTETGLRAVYELNKNIELMAGINEGWDTIRANNPGPTGEFRITDNFNPIFSLALTDYIGSQRAADLTSTGPAGTRNLMDIVATLNATQKLQFMTECDYGVQNVAALPDDVLGRANWAGIAQYLNYKFNDKWQTSLRGEYYDDAEGYRTGVAQAWKELTLTLGFTPTKNLEFRAETRRDFSNVDSFQNDTGTAFYNYQQSFALEAFYKFG